MRHTFKSIILIFSIFAISVGMGVNPALAQGDGSEEEIELYDPDELDRDILHAYIRGSVKASILKKRVLDKLETANTVDEKNEIYRQARIDMVNAIEEGGEITIEEFEKISKTAQKFPELQLRIISEYNRIN